MSYTAVRSYTRNGHQVRAHTRRTNGSAVAEVLMRGMYRAYERLDRENTAPVGPVGGDPACAHPDWYAVRRLLLDTPYEGSPILAFCCTSCAATKARERVLAETEERV